MAKDAHPYDYREPQEEHDRKKPSPIARLVGKATAALRADRDMVEVLRTWNALNPSAIEKCTVAEARAQPTPADAVKALLESQGRETAPEALVPGIAASDLQIPGPDCALPVRVYRPEGEGPFPGVVYFHGGGWVMADLHAYDHSARGLAAAAGAVVVSVGYRLAPEARFPAAWSDAQGAYRWVAAHAHELDIDPRRLSLAGESAGGNLALATAVQLKTEPVPQPRHILAVYPVTQTGNLATTSYLENALGQPLNRAMVPWFLDKVLREPEEKRQPKVDLIHSNLSGLPPVTIINATLDPLRSDGAMLENVLRRWGVPVARRDFSGVTHEFFGMAPVVDKARKAQAWAGQRLRASLGS